MANTGNYKIVKSQFPQRLSEKGTKTQLVYYHQKRNYPIATWFDSETGLVSSGITAEQAQQRGFDLNELFSVELEIRRM